MASQSTVTIGAPYPAPPDTSSIVIYDNTPANNLVTLPAASGGRTITIYVSNYANNAGFVNVTPAAGDFIVDNLATTPYSNGQILSLAYWGQFVAGHGRTWRLVQGN